MPSLSGNFAVQSWDENVFQELEGEKAKLTRASVKQRFSGDIEGFGSVEWLMCYAPDGTARFVGLQRIEGMAGGRQGSFVVESNGNFDGELARGSWAVVPGSGTGGFSGISGSGSFQAPHGPEATFQLEYQLS